MASVSTPVAEQPKPAATSPSPAKPIPPGAKPAAPTAAKPADAPDDKHDDHAEARRLLHIDRQSVLPGVEPDIPDEELVGAGVTRITSKAELRAEHEAAEDQAKTGAVRGPDGKFVSSKPAEPEVKKDAPQATPPEDKVQEQASDEPPAAPYVFAKREFKSQAHAEQVFDSFRGRVEKLAQVEKSLSERERERDEAIERANQWATYAKQLQEGKSPADAAGEAATTTHPNRTPQQPPSAAPATDRALAALSSDERRVAKDMLLHPSKYGYTSPEDALIELIEFAADKIADGKSQQINSRLEAVSKPITEQRAVAEAARVSTELWSKFADHQVDGNLAFPELRDPPFASRALQHWVAMGKPNEERMIHYAILLTRNEQLQRSTTPAEDDLSSLLPPEIEDTPRNQPAMSASPDDAPRSLRPRRGSNDSDEVKRLKDSILKSGLDAGGLPGVSA